jgi:hypothetical protein
MLGCVPAPIAMKLFGFRVCAHNPIAYTSSAARRPIFCGDYSSRSRKDVLVFHSSLWYIPVCVTGRKRSSNGQLLKDADLLVAVFWTRIGSPTGAARSGTVEEIEEHIQAGKSAMIYFSSAPVRPDSIDNDQDSALKAFRESLRVKGLFEEYESLSEFRTKFARQLAQRIISKFPGDISSISTNATPVVAAPPPIPAIGAAARELLTEASKDQQGVVMSLQTLGGSIVQANGRDFTERGNSRSEAQWRGAVAELSKLHLLEDRAGKGEVFFVTDEGYRTSDLLKQQ